jgi:putative transposase
MGDSYTQSYIQLVFAVKCRQSFIQRAWAKQLHKYITAVMENDGHKMLAINGMPDHIHIFFGLNPTISISDIVKDVKRASNNWIKSNKLVTGNFAWQNGYGAFSYSRLSLQQVCNYIEKQEEHYIKTSFKEEYISLLSESEIQFKPEYLFEFYE